MLPQQYPINRDKVSCVILLARELEPTTVVRPCHSCNLDDVANDLGVERENHLVFDHGQQPGVLLLLVITIDRGCVDQLLETLGIGSKRSAGHETLLMQVLGATAPGADGGPRDRWPHNPGLPTSAVPHCECRMRLGAACDGAGQ